MGNLGGGFLIRLKIFGGMESFEIGETTLYGDLCPKIFWDTGRWAQKSFFKGSWGRQKKLPFPRKFFFPPFKKGGPGGRNTGVVSLKRKFLGGV